MTADEIAADIPVELLARLLQLRPILERNGAVVPGSKGIRRLRYREAAASGRCVNSSGQGPRMIEGVLRMRRNSE